MNSKGAIRLFSIIKPLLFVIIIIGLFFFYNRFLVDRSLESLRFSLSTVANAETVGSVSYVAPLMQVHLIDGLSSAGLDTEELMRLQYSADTIGGSHAERGVADIASIMQGIINKKEKKRNIVLRFFDKINSFLKRLFKIKPAAQKKGVKAINIASAILEEINSYENKGELEEAIKLYRDTIAKFPDYIQTPALMLRLGFLLHKLGRFDQAELLYDEVISRFSPMAESKVAAELMAKIEERADLDKEVKEMTSRITTAQDIRIKQRLYYELGLMELSVLNLKKAKGSFKRAISMLPDTDITTQSYLRLGICEKLLGNLDASVEAFKKASDITKSTKLRTQSKYHLAQSYRQKGEYTEAATALDDIAKVEQDKDIKSLLLFQKGSTLLYDEKDVARAKEVFDDLMRRYSASALVSSGSETSFVDFVKKHVDLNILARRPEELEKALEKAWVEALLPKKILDIVEANSRRVIYALNRTVGGVAKAKERALNEGIYLQVELSEAELNDFVKRSLPATRMVDFSDISIKFEGDQKMTISLGILQKGRPIKISVTGKLKMVSIASAPSWVSATAQRNLLIFLVEKCSVGNIPVPPDIMNPLFRPAVKNFNESFPLDIEEFRLNRSTILFAGPIRASYLRRLKATPGAGPAPSMRGISGILAGDVSVKKLKGRVR